MNIYTNRSLENRSLEKLLEILEKLLEIKEKIFKLWYYKDTIIRVLST
ncbi:hypothetical protein [Natranaerobius trueperi]|nr:hypothetical protein [Natranaerobius trueperi]